MFKDSEILVTGGSGLLGTTLKDIKPDYQYPSHAAFDITDYSSIDNYTQDLAAQGINIKCILHFAAFTSPPKVEKDPKQALLTNIVGTANVVRLCMKYNIRMLYTSTDYVFDGESGNYKETDPVLPTNIYAWSKLGGETAALMYDKSLIIRMSISPDEFPHPKAWIDQWTSRETAAQTCTKIIKLADSDVTGIIHIGGRRQSVYEFAKSLSPDKDIGTLERKNANYAVPKDTSLDSSLYERSIV